jgi:hypothetical protein
MASGYGLGDFEKCIDDGWVDAVYQVGDMAC